MKTILRIFIILAVTAVIGGLVFLLVNNSSVSTARVGPGRSGDRQFGGHAGFTEGDQPAGFNGGARPDHDRGMEGSGLFSWAETVKNLIVVAVLVVVVAVVERLVKPKRARKVAPVAVSAPPADGKP